MHNAAEDGKRSLIAGVVAGTVVVLGLGLVIVDTALAVSDIGKNVGQEVNSWGKWLLYGAACLFALPALSSRDFPGVLIIGAMVVVIGGFVFAPDAITGMIRDFWRSIRGAG